VCVCVCVCVYIYIYIYIGKIVWAVKSLIGVASAKKVDANGCMEGSVVVRG